MPVAAGAPMCPSGRCPTGAEELPAGSVGGFPAPAVGSAVTTVPPPPLPSAGPLPSSVKAAAATATAPTKSSPEMRIPRETAMTPPEVLAPDG
ncbi:hypothetical protein [Streptomyces coerulescens]|uniref:Uncharacterized protein n=1 Tax=Streptomyces coerulescens TaxID=29304 RepID=A0ABW0CJ55_STRCD